MEVAGSLPGLPFFLFFSYFLLLHQPRLLLSQQVYVNNKQLACEDTSNNNFTEGFACNGLRNSCRSYLTFRSTHVYSSLLSVAYLLNSQPYMAEMISINNFTDVEPVAPDTMIIAPVDCACSSSYYQHNASYILKPESGTYFLVANDTYQGLTTCQALMAENPYDARNLSKGMNLTVPLRCACPTANQSSAGAKYLLSYLVTWGDSISSIAKMFEVSEKSVLDANELTERSVIFPFTPILVPLSKEPTKIVPAPPAASPPETPAAVPKGDGSSKKWVFVGVGVGGGALVIALVALALWFFCYYPQKRKQPKSSGVTPNKSSETSTTDYASVQVKDGSLSGFSSGIRDAIETLTVYTYQDLQAATGFFSEENKIKGSVYRGKFKNDDAAVKVLKGDVSREINILRRINHSNIVRLSGFCVHEGNTYLVYEYAENGSLRDWLHFRKFESCSVLSWKQRAQVAYHIADALNYLHNYTNPPYIHKNLKSSNILMDANFRAMVANFGLARVVEDSEEGGLQMTRHVVGTQGYMAPEYIENGLITPKLDVFALGVVILELLSGREAAGDSKNGEELLSAAIKRVLDGDNVREKLRGFIDSSLKNEYPLDLAFSMAELAKRCIADDLNARPEVAEVFVTLSKIFSSSLDWDPSDELDRSQSVNESHSR